jgi:Na+-transporting NADH:ubiquinone oxidoreductase subunit C
MRESVGKTFAVALLLCVVCSVLVSSAAVMLRPTQAINKAMDKKRNILMAADLFEEGKSIDELFSAIEAKVVDLETGRYVEGVDAEAFDQRRAAKDPASSLRVPVAEDLGNIKRRSNQAGVYLVYKNDKVSKVILPIHGMGLWSTLYGFVALDARDFNTIKGLVYYEHGETPGLGGEVDNPNWKALWNGKQAFGADGKVRIEVIKGAVNPAGDGAQHQVDGLSGATITARGVSNMLKFWLGARGFGPYLTQLKAQGGRHG